MWGGPEVDLHRTGAWQDVENQVRIKLDMAGATHVRNRGQEITDQRAAELLGISEQFFAQASVLAATGLRDGEAAMAPPSHDVEQPSTAVTEPDEVVNVTTPGAAAGSSPRAGRAGARAGRRRGSPPLTTPSAQFGGA